MLSTDEIILEELEDVRLDYPVLIASRRGLHINHTVQRCRELERRGLVETVSGEVTYRITESGRRYLQDDVNRDKLDKG